MSRYDDIDAIITALGGSATAEEMEYALRDYPDREVRTVLAERAAAGGGGAAPTFAQVSYRGALVDPWDGSPVQFNTVDSDAEGLWDAGFKSFVITTAGWYYVNVWGVVSMTAAGNTSGRLFVQCYGAGDNVGSWMTITAGETVNMPSVSGHVHLDVGDALDVEGVTTPVSSHDDLFFSLVLVSADA